MVCCYKYLRDEFFFHYYIIATMKFLSLALAAFVGLIAICVSDDELFKKFHQHDYKVEYVRSEVVSFDPQVFKTLKLVTYKYNRTTAFTNMSLELTIDIKEQFDIIVQAYKFTSNEYRQFPLRMRLNYCTFLDMNVAGIGEAFKKQNFDVCPFLKNINYYFINFAPDESRFPPYVPSGEFKSEIIYLYKDDEIARTFMFIRIYRPFVTPK